ncbi:MAG: asparagine synthase-related protein [Telluria sp.]|nr:asparagine synthase-related protein [Telluria sp.]
MSGIAGIIHFDGRPVEPGEIESMTGAMRHRGPDGLSHWRSGGAALGQCMLCSTPESLSEVQPLRSVDDDAVLVMDGRIDNWEELRAELAGKGVALRTRADAELVLRAYAVWGRECLSHIEGDFAFVVWDARRREAFCARDRVGNRPFNYRWDGATLVFASDIHAILQLPWVPRELNEGFVAEHLSTEWRSRDETFWQGIGRLEPAHWMVFSVTGDLGRRYWRPDFEATLQFRRDEDYVEHYRAVVIDTVRRMSRSHRKLACEVSGGLDSSAVLAVAEYLRTKSALLAPGLEAYCLDFRGDALADEHRFSDAVSRHVGVPLHLVAPGRFPVSWYREFASAYKELPGFPNWTMILPLYERAKSAGAVAILGGSGGDEWLGAAESWAVQAVRQADVHEATEFLLRHVPTHGLAASGWMLIRHGLLPTMPAATKRVIRSAFAAAGLGRPVVHSAWLSAAMTQRLRERRPALAGRAGISEAQVHQLELLEHPFILFGREMSERQAALVGVERRQPFWSRAIIEAAFATPDRLRRRMGIDKWLHRTAMAQLLPDAVVGRTDKADFLSVFAQGRHELLQQLSSGLGRGAAEWVDHPALRRSLDSDEAGSHVRRELGLWSLVMLDALARSQQH